MDTNLELDITREGNTFKIEAVTPYGKGTGFFELDPSLNSKMYDIQDCVEEQKLLDNKFVEEMGTRLFETLFSPIEKLFHECLDRSDHVTIILNTKDFEIIKLPWELCYDPDYHLFLGADPRCSFVRRDEKSETSPPSVNYPLKVLIIVSSPMDLDEKGQYQPDPDEIMKLMEPVQELAEKGMLTIDLLERASVDRIQDRLKEGYHVVHFVGHGAYDGEKGHLVIEDKNRNEKVLEEREVSHLFGLNPPQLLFLTACESSPLIPLLLSRKIPAVLAMQYTVLKDVAHHFVERFYSFLLQGEFSLSGSVSGAQLCPPGGRGGLHGLVHTRDICEE